MKKPTNKKLVIGVALLLCLPLFVIAEGLYAYLTPQWYYSTAFVEVGKMTSQEINEAFQVTQSPDVSLQKVSNTDLVAIQARDKNSRQAAEKANSIAAMLVQKLPKEDAGFPRVVAPAEPSDLAVRVSVPLNMIVGAVLGLVPAIVGIILIILGNRAVVPGVSPAKGT